MQTNAFAIFQLLLAFFVNGNTQSNPGRHTFAGYMLLTVGSVFFREISIIGPVSQEGTSFACSLHFLISDGLSCSLTTLYNGVICKFMFVLFERYLLEVLEVRP